MKPQDTSTTTRAIRAIDHILMALGAVGLLAMMLHISADVLAGLLFNDPLAVTSAFVTQYYMIAVAFLPLAAAEYRGVHIGVDLVVNKLPAAPRRGLHLLVLVITLGVYLLLTAQAWEQALKKLGTSAFIMEQMTRISVWPSYFVLPASFAVIAALIAVKLVLCLAGRPEPLVEDAATPATAEGSGNV